MRHVNKLWRFRLSWQSEKHWRLWAFFIAKINMFLTNFCSVLQYSKFISIPAIICCRSHDVTSHKHMTQGCAHLRNIDCEPANLVHTLLHCDAITVSCVWRMRIYTLRLFSHESKVRNLNLNLKCAFWIKIWKTVFWTVCMPNYIAMHHLKCAFQMMVRRCFPVTHLANHTAKSPYECPDL